MAGRGLRIDSVGLVADAALWSTWVMMLGVAPQAGAGSGPLVQALANGPRFTKGGSPFFPKTRQNCFFDCRQPRDAQKKVVFLGSNAKVLLLSMWDTTLQFLILVFTPSSSSSTLT